MKKNFSNKYIIKKNIKNNNKGEICYSQQIITLFVDVKSTIILNFRKTYDIGNEILALDH